MTKAAFSRQCLHSTLVSNTCIWDVLNIYSGYTGKHNYLHCEHLLQSHCIHVLQSESLALEKLYITQNTPMHTVNYICTRATTFMTD